ncbi:Uncharacterised protein [Porphyromonas macacae]|uniref:Uncharacterized protein n=1 Tax=Porphyromonas macacae TaxID=28115 RepID=A0A379E725_9PORP|nr:hypothetical protein [Porphyromonas macacae]SUB88132.1 Uncharacterised protein [Porphyromonas macacae]
MNIYKYAFYLFYKFGKKIKTPDPAFAAVCVATAVMFLHLAFVVGFLYSMGILPVLKIFFDNSIGGKLLALSIGYTLLVINVRYIFGLKRREYHDSIKRLESDSRKKKIIKTLTTFFFILILPLLFLFFLWHIQ